MMVTFAQRLLRNQFPAVDGLGYTLLQAKPPVMKIMRYYLKGEPLDRGT